MRSNLPLNALRAFESSARHLNFTHAALELNVTQAAVSQQVRMLEERLGTILFKRLPRGLSLTDEGCALLPVLSDAFGRIESVLKKFDGGQFREVLSVGVVGTFALGWLMPRLRLFQESHPIVELRMFTHNNKVDPAAEGLDFAIRFGDGAWPTTQNIALLEAPLAVLCAPEIAQRLHAPGDLVHETLLRSYRNDEWNAWFAAAGLEPWMLNGPIFDSSRLMVEVAMQGTGLALAPPAMFAREIQSGRLVCPFGIQIRTGSYWLTWLKSRQMSPAMKLFHDWLLEEAGRLEPPRVSSAVAAGLHRLNKT